MLVHGSHGIKSTSQSKLKLEICTNHHLHLMKGFDLENNYLFLTIFFINTVGQ